MNRTTCLGAAVLLFCHASLLAETQPLFDGKTFAGWEGDTSRVWRIENAEIVAGSLGVKQPLNSFLCTTRDYADFELNLEYKRLENNGGIQFRSERVPNHHEVSGYQADFAPGIDGCLYDESRRNRFLTVFGVEGVDLSSDEGRPGQLIKRAMELREENARKLSLGEWNRYRIRAEGARIRLWINDVLTTDYTEKDPAIPLTGKIAVQIHSGATEIRYRNLRIEELSSSRPKALQPVALSPGEVVALVGGANVERSRFYGFLQTHLLADKPERKLRVRNFGWEGDTVFEQWRDAGTAHWRQQRDWGQQLSEAGATLVLAQFGQMESLAGLERLPAFLEAYTRLIREFSASGRKVVLVSPMPFEKPPAGSVLAARSAGIATAAGTASAPFNPDLSSRNAVVRAYAEGIRDLAAREGLPFVDMFGVLEKLPRTAESARLTDNGHHLNEHGQRVVAGVLAGALGVVPKPEAQTGALRAAVLELERLWFDHWRPMNWAFLAGDRTGVAFSQDWRDGSKRIFPEEMKAFLPLLQRADENAWNAAGGGTSKSPVSRGEVAAKSEGLTPPQTPEEELASFKVLDGFRVNLFASERDGVVKPIQMRWDERGRLWVACAVSYPQIKPGAKANDYVLVCEDTDGDGRADKFHKFVEGLFMPSGIELGDGGLYVANGTELLHFRDTDGDGKADSKRVVLGGFGTADSHQMINCLNWGFGGELWFSQGHHIYSRVETPYGVETLNRAGVWRWRPRTQRLDPFFQWSTAGANIWGVITDDFGQPFHKSGATIGGYFSTPGLARSSLAVSAEALNLFVGRTKQVGMEIVGSSHMPPEMQGRFLIGGYYVNVLEQHELLKNDVGLSSRQLPNLIETSNKVFRPVDVRSGPDGGMYVADWYNPIIGHYQASYRHPDRDSSHGRIWRITAANRPLVRPPALHKMAAAELLQHVDSPERWVKYQAKRLLFERESREVVAALDAWVATITGEDAAAEYRRLQALSLYEAQETLRRDLLERLLVSRDARVRAYATRSVATWAREGLLPSALKLLERQIADPDPMVRLEAIVALSYVPEPGAALVAARALDLPFNAYHKHALTKTLHGSNSLWAPPLLAGSLAFAKEEHLLFALQNGWVDNNPADMLNHWGGARDYTLVSAAASKVASLMRRQLEASAADEPRQVLWLKALAAVGDAADLELVLERGRRKATVLEALALSPAAPKARPKSAEIVLSDLISSTEPELAAVAMRLTGLWKLHPLAERVRRAAGQAGGTPVVRKAAIEALGMLGGPESVLVLGGVLDAPQDSGLHIAALDALSVANVHEAAKRVVSALRAAKSGEDAAAVLRVILARTDGHAALGKELEKPEALSREAARLALRTLNEIGRSSRQLANLLMALSGMNTALPPYTKELVSATVRAAQSTGDVAAGKLVYERAGCAACHAVAGAGGKTGPDLSGLSRSLPIDMIVTEVLWPAINVKEGYESATATLKDGTVITGFKHTDSTEALVIRDLNSGELRTVKHADAQRIQTGGSIMPEGVLAAFSEQDLANLIRYLSELGK